MYALLATGYGNTLYYKNGQSPPRGGNSYHFNYFHSGQTLYPWANMVKAISICTKNYRKNQTQCGKDHALYSIWILYQLHCIFMHKMVIPNRSRMAWVCMSNRRGSKDDLPHSSRASVAIKTFFKSYFFRSSIIFSAATEKVGVSFFLEIAKSARRRCTPI